MPSCTHSICGIAIVIAALTATACGGGRGAERPAANAKADGPGVVTGKISFDGEAPARAAVRMAADPNCTAGRETLSETTIVGPDKGIKNVFVYVKDGFGDRVYEAPPTPIVMDQQ